jgi:hypothetical protein
LGKQLRQCSIWLSARSLYDEESPAIFAKAQTALYEDQMKVNVCWGGVVFLLKFRGREDIKVVDKEKISLMYIMR